MPSTPIALLHIVIKSAFIKIMNKGMTIWTQKNQVVSYVLLSIFIYMMYMKDSLIRKTAFFTFSDCSFKVSLPPMKGTPRKVFSVSHMIRVLFSKAKSYSVRVSNHLLNTIYRMLLTMERVKVSIFSITFHAAEFYHSFFDTAWVYIKLLSASLTNKPLPLAFPRFWCKLRNKILTLHVHIIHPMLRLNNI